MSLLAPWWLAGLLALVPLLALHLRRRRRQVEVDSLLLWRDQAGAAPARQRARLVPSLLLLLQALVVVLLVVALARPSSGGGPPGAGAAPQLFVLDPTALHGSRAQLDARLADLPPTTPVSIVLASTTPRLIANAATPATARQAATTARHASDAAREATTAAGQATTPAGRATPAAGEVSADASRATAEAPGPADLRAGLALAAGQLHRRGGAITLLHARGTTPPPVRADGVGYEAVAVGEDDPVALEDASVRCAPAQPAAATSSCTVFAAVRNSGTRAARVRLAVERGGGEPVSRSLTVAGGERVELAFAARAAARVTLRLTRPGAPDVVTSVVVPRPDAPAAVTLVSDRPTTAPLARALAATPGVTLRLLAPDDYDAAAEADLVVFDRWLPAGSLPQARALLLVAPPRLPGGSVGGALAEPVLSGLADDEPLLAGVDLDGLALAAGAARRTTLPPGLRAIAWAPGGPLLATGAAPGERAAQTTLLTFDVATSTLPQLPAFPALLANVVAAAHDPSWIGDRQAPGSPNGPVTLAATDGGGPLPAPPRAWWPWLVAAGLLALLAEWSYPRWSRRREAAA